MRTYEASLLFMETVVKYASMKPMYDEIDLEKSIHSVFGLRIEIKSTVADKLPVGEGATAKIFLSSKGMLFTMITPQRVLTLGDVKKIVSRMNLKAEQFMPPHADANYFDRVATARFKEVFPGREVKHDSDLMFYRTLVPYSPALIQISEVKSGMIKQFDRDAASGWRPSIKFAYRRIRTS